MVGFPFARVWASPVPRGLASRRGRNEFVIPRLRRGRLRRARRWHDTVATLTESQAQYVAWRDALPANLQDSALADALQAICDLDLTELQAIDPPRGFGRD